MTTSYTFAVQSSEQGEVWAAEDPFEPPMHYSGTTSTAEQVAADILHTRMHAGHQGGDQGDRWIRVVVWHGDDEGDIEEASAIATIQRLTAVPELDDAEAAKRAAKIAELARLEAAFDEAGGRGVDIADQIDRLRAELAPEDPEAARYAHTIMVLIGDEQQLGKIPAGVTTWEELAEHVDADRFLTIAGLTINDHDVIQAAIAIVEQRLAAGTATPTEGA
jgi:hypothetical protein